MVNAPLQKLRDINSGLNNLNNLDELNNLISRNSADLYSALSNNSFFVDKDEKREIDRIYDRLTIGGSLISEAQAEISRLRAERTALPGGSTSNTRRAEIGTEISKLLRITGGTEAIPGDGSTTRIGNRRNEYTELKSKIDSFNFDSTLIDHPHTLGTANSYTNLNDASKFNCIPSNGFHFFDNDGKKLTASSGGKYTFKMKLDNGTEQNVQIEGLSIVGNNINITNNLKFNPPNVDFSNGLQLKIGGVFENVGGTGINVIHTKNLKINITDPNKQDLARRNTTFDDYNTTGGGTKIEDRLLSDYSKEHYKRERDALIRAVKKNDGPKYDKYLDTPEKQEAFYQRIRKKDHPNGGGVFFDRLHTDLAIHTLGIAPDTYGRSLNNYDDFKGWFTAKERDWNKENSPQIKSKSAYMNFIHNELENKVGEYFDNSLDSEMSNNLDINMFLKSEISAFATEIDKTRDENNTHLDVESDLTTGERMETLKKDKEYIRFFKGSSWKTEKQEVNLNMNRSPEDVDNPEPLKYDMAIDVKGRNNVQVMINIEGQKPIPFKSGQPHTIIEKILRRRDIPHGSARVHMAYNVMKGFVEMAKEKHIDLSYYDESTTLYHTIDVDEKGNLTKKTIDRNGLSYTQTNETLFDYQNFINAPSFDNAIHRGALRQGINRTLAHFTLAMNGVHAQYHESNRRRFWFGIKKSKNHFHFPRLQSIGGMNFETTVNTSSGAINISCERNRFTISGGPLEKEKTSKDLGKLLNIKVKGERIFDGAEHEAMETIYSAMLEKLREQKHIKKTNFGVRDHRTGKLYILDKNGDFGIMREDQISVNNPIRKSNNKTKVGQIDDSELAGGMDLVNEEEKHNLLRNPELMYMLVNAMSNRTKFFNLRHLKSGRVAHWWRKAA